MFKVTDCPEIHSNGFHLRFDKTCGSMGYILPHWAEDERPLDTQLTPFKQLRSEHATTTQEALSESKRDRNTQQHLFCFQLDHQDLPPSAL